MRKSITAAALLIAAAAGFAGTSPLNQAVELKNRSADRAIPSEALKTDKQTNKQTKATTVGSRHYSFNKFPRSRKTTTAAQLKRTATKRRNIEKRAR